MSKRKVLDSKPLKIVFDPDVHFAVRVSTSVQRNRHRSARDPAPRRRDGDGAQLALPTADGSGGETVGEKSDIPANVKTQFESLNKEFDAIERSSACRPTPERADVAAEAADAVARSDPENGLARTSTPKTQLAGVWEAPSPASVHQYNDVKLALPKAVADGNAFLGKANAVSQALAKYG
jgi:hypothetical protein